MLLFPTKCASRHTLRDKGRGSRDGANKWGLFQLKDLTERNRITGNQNWEYRTQLTGQAMDRIDVNARTTGLGSTFIQRLTREKNGRQLERITGHKRQGRCRSHQGGNRRIGWAANDILLVE